MLIWYISESGHRRICLSMAEPGPSRAGAAVRKYKTTYNSKPGTLLISQTTLNWVPDVAGAEKVPTQQLSRIISKRTYLPGISESERLMLRFGRHVHF
jgi:hypothetical protein